MPARVEAADEVSGTQAREQRVEGARRGQRQRTEDAGTGPGVADQFDGGVQQRSRFARGQDVEAQHEPEHDVVLLGERTREGAVSRAVAGGSASIEVEEGVGLG